MLIRTNLYKVRPVTVRMGRVWFSCGVPLLQTPPPLPPESYHHHIISSSYHIITISRPYTINLGRNLANCRVCRLSNHNFFATKIFLPKFSHTILLFKLAKINEFPDDDFV